LGADLFTACCRAILFQIEAIFRSATWCIARKSNDELEQKSLQQGCVFLLRAA